MPTNNHEYLDRKIFTKTSYGCTHHSQTIDVKATTVQVQASKATRNQKFYHQRTKNDFYAVPL